MKKTMTDEQSKQFKDQQCHLFKLLISHPCVDNFINSKTANSHTLEKYKEKVKLKRKKK